MLLAAGVTAAVLLAVGTSGRDRHPAVPTPPAPLLPSPSRPAVTAVSSPMSPITFEFLGGFEAGARWELFVRTDTELIRIQPAAGRVTHTVLPALLTSGPVALLPEPDAVVIRPLDAVPGYRVPDGLLPVPLSGLLAGHGPALPGPGAGQLWVPTADDRAMDLVGLDGVGSTFSIPLGTDDGLPRADGAGGLLIRRPRGVFDVGDRRDLLVTEGEVIAAGGGRFLARECGPSACRLVVADVHGKRRVLSGAPARLRGDRWSGVISPDGRRAALPDPVTGQVHVLDLDTGTDLPTAATADLLVATGGALAWLPGSTRLVIIESSRSVALVDAISGGRKGFWLTVGPAYQLAVRNL